MTDLLDLNGVITLRDKILRLSDLSNGISNGTIPDKIDRSSISRMITANDKRKELMGYINECPQLIYLCIFGSISQYDQSFAIKYPNYNSSCTTISVLSAISILNTFKSKIPTSEDIDKYIIDGIIKHKEIVDSGSNPSAIVEDIIQIPEIKSVITESFEYNGSLLREHGMWFDNMIETLYDNNSTNDRPFATLITASLETILLILHSDKSRNVFLIFDPHARPELCNNSASLIQYYSEEDILNRLTIRFPEPANLYDPVTGAPEEYDPIMVQFTATSFNVINRI